MRVKLVYPAGFRVKSMSTALFFLEKVLQPGTTEVPDADDKTLYHVFVKDESYPEKVCLGSAHYGKDPITAEIPFCDNKAILKRTYLLRKSINKLLSEK